MCSDHIAYGLNKSLPTVGLALCIILIKISGDDAGEDSGEDSAEDSE